MVLLRQNVANDDMVAEVLRDALEEIQPVQIDPQEQIMSANLLQSKISTKIAEFEG